MPGCQIQRCLGSQSAPQQRLQALESEQVEEEWVSQKTSMIHRRSRSQSMQLKPGRSRARFADSRLFSVPRGAPHQISKWCFGSGFYWGEGRTRNFIPDNLVPMCLLLLDHFGNFPSRHKCARANRSTMSAECMVHALSENME